MAKGKGKTPKIAAATKANARKAMTAAALSSNKDQLAVMTELMKRFEFLQKAGIQYGGKRDLWTAAGYERQPTFQHYNQLYKRGDVAGRIVDMAPKTTWRTGPTIIEEGEDDETPFTTAFADMAKRLKLWRYFERVDRMAGIGRYAVLLIGTRGGEDLSTPLKKVQGPESVIYLAAYHEGNADITEWITDANDPRFGQPKMYKVRFTSGIQNFRPTGKTPELHVHWTRIIHVAEDLLEDEVFGRPRLERPLNRMFDLDKIAASTGEAYWQSVVKILQAKIDPKADISPEDMKLLDERLLEMIHDLRRQITAQGVDVGWIESSIPSVKDVGDFYFSLIAGAAGIPQRILFGSEMGELASTTDQENWFGLISERQEQFAEPTIVRAFIDRMIEINALPAPESEDYLVSWPTLFEESDEEIANTNLKIAQQAQALTPVGGDPMTLVEIDDEGNIKLLPQTPDEAEERSEAAEELLNAPPPPPGTPPEPEIDPSTGEPKQEPTPEDEEDDETDDATQTVVAEGNPYKVVKRGSKFCVVKASGGATVKCHASKSAALAHFRALEANVEDA